VTTALPQSWSVTLAVSPVPKGRPRMGNGRVYTPARTAQFETTVRWLLRQQHIPLLTAAELRVDVQFWVARMDADADNYLKALFDATNKIGWRDDRQVREVHACLDKAAGGIEPHIEFACRVRLSWQGTTRPLVIR
jgi:Holliday junction resolvase RusA-like endonuclease